MKRTWDESNSPQWRYLLSRESEQRKGKRLFKEEGEVKRNKPGKSKVRKKNPTTEKQFNKAGQKIVYSASPGSEHTYMHNPKPITSISTLLKNHDNESTRILTGTEEQE